MARELGMPPRSRVGRVWNELVHRLALVRWIDEWWWERSRVACEAGSYLSEIGVVALGLTVLGLPAVLVLAAGRVVSHLDETHMAFRAWRSHDMSLFNQSQTWHRTRDGRIQRLPGFDEPELVRLADSRAWPARAVSSVRGWASDFWTEGRRMPAFIIGMATPVIGYIAGTYLHEPRIATIGIIYGGLVAQHIPTARNVVLAAVHRSWDHVARPQRVAKPRPSQVLEPEAVVGMVPGPALAGPVRAAPRITSLVGRVTVRTTTAGLTRCVTEAPVPQGRQLVDRPSGVLGL